VAYKRAKTYLEIFFCPLFLQLLFDLTDNRYTGIWTWWWWWLWWWLPIVSDTKIGLGKAALHMGENKMTFKSVSW